jgi:hypothetical protein
MLIYYSSYFYILFLNLSKATDNNQVESIQVQSEQGGSTELVVFFS